MDITSKYGYSMLIISYKFDNLERTSSYGYSEISIEVVPLNAHILYYDVFVKDNFNNTINKQFERNVLDTTPPVMEFFYDIPVTGKEISIVIKVLDNWENGSFIFRYRIGSTWSEPDPISGGHFIIPIPVNIEEVTFRIIYWDSSWNYMTDQRTVPVVDTIPPKLIFSNWSILRKGQQNIITFNASAVDNIIVLYLELIVWLENGSERKVLFEREGPYDYKTSIELDYSVKSINFIIIIVDSQNNTFSSEKKRIDIPPERGDPTPMLIYITIAIFLIIVFSSISVFLFFLKRKIL